MDGVGIGHSGLKKVVAGPKGVEHHVGVWQQILSAFLGQPDSIPEHLERIDLGQLGDSVETAKGSEPVHQQAGLAFETPLQRPECRRCKDWTDDLTCACMRWWVGLQQQTWRPPWLLLTEITQAGTGCRRKGFPILEGGVHLLIACHPPNTIAL